MRRAAIYLKTHLPRSPVYCNTTNGLITQRAKKRLLARSCFSKSLTQRNGVVSFVGVFLPRWPLVWCQHLAASERSRGVGLVGLGSEDGPGSRECAWTEAFPVLGVRQAPGPGRAGRGGPLPAGGWQAGRACRVTYPFSWRPRGTWFASGAWGSLVSEKEHRIRAWGHGRRARQPGRV